MTPPLACCVIFSTALTLGTLLVVLLPAGVRHDWSQPAADGLKPNLPRWREVVWIPLLVAALFSFLAWYCEG